MNVRLAAALVAAAISLKAPLEDAATQLRAASPGEAITFTFGSSGQLAAQIEQGAPVDLFVSASPLDMDRIAKAGRIDAATRAAVAGNTLVVVVRKGIEPPQDVTALVGPRFARIAIGNPKTVPAGRYAQETLGYVGLAQELSPRLVFAENARAVADLVARGEADAGFVYATDVASEGDKLTLAFEVDGAMHAPIVYEAAVIRGAASAARARAFLDFLTSAAGRATLAKHGFPKAATAAAH